MKDVHRGKARSTRKPTERKYTERLRECREALSVSEERLKVVSELTTDYTCIIGVDDQGRPQMLWASDSMAKMTGRDMKDAMTLEQWRETIHPDDRARYMEFVGHTFATGESGELECRSLSKAGIGRSIRILVKPQRDEKGTIRTVLVGVKDITDRMRAEELLRQSAHEWAVTFNSIADPIMLLDADQRIKQCNAAFLSLSGRGIEEIRGRKCHEIVHGKDRPIQGCPFVAMSGSGSRESTELLHDGRSFEVLTDPIVDSLGAPAGAVHIMSDITEQKKMEREKAVVEEELRQALKMEAIGRLAGGVAHDFNNMLTGIMGNAELLQLELSHDPAAAGYIGKIITAVEHAAGLTGQLLAFARKGQYQLVPLDLHRLIGETVGILENTIDRRIRIEQNLRARPSTVRGDPSQLENALMNLSLNARDAMPDGGRLSFLTDTVELHRGDLEHAPMKIEPGTYVRVSVADTGTGMPPDVQSHLFEPFFTTKEPGKGTGLGLAGVYGNIMNHHGAIEVDSVPGRGSVFSIYLPTVDQKALERDAPRAEKAALDSGSILVVDDEPAILDVARQILTRRGFSVHVCGNGREAVEFFTRRHAAIDLVILDMIMPEMDGPEAFSLMKKIDPGVRVLLSSGYSVDTEVQGLAAEGVRGFVQKPYRQAELLLKIREALAGRRPPPRD